MRKALRLRDGMSLARVALQHGAVAKPFTSIEWDVSGDCMSRVFVEKMAYPSRWDHDEARLEGRQRANPLWVDTWVPCRRCAACLKRRARHWAYRAKAEIGSAPRSWFGTLTIRPEEHFTFLNSARVRNRRAGTTWETLSSEQQFTERVNECSPEITRWFKRIRKESGAKLRYCLVAEAHKTGLPHWHILIHEVQGGGVVRHRVLSDQWKLGFSKFNLVEDQRAAWYVSKYLAKSSLARVRASLGYGKHGLDAIGELVEPWTKQAPQNPPPRVIRTETQNE